MLPPRLEQEFADTLACLAGICRAGRETVALHLVDLIVDAIEHGSPHFLRGALPTLLVPGVVFGGRGGEA